MREENLSIGAVMNRIWKTSALCLAGVLSYPVYAAPSIEASIALTRYCEPLVSGATAAKITETAKADGFKGDKVGNHPALIKEDVIVMVSDAPRVCTVQATPAMTFAQGIALVDQWASRHPGAVKSPTSTGPDGARVRAWSAPKEKRYLLVSEQSHPRGDKVLAFILAPLPQGQR